MQNCVSIIETGLDDAIEASRKAVGLGADLIEVRFDNFAQLPQDFSGFKEFQIPKIATLRSAAQGGNYKGSDENKLRFLVRAYNGAFDFIDLEDDFPLLHRRDLDGIRIIVSSHIFDASPRLMTVVDRLVANGSKGDTPKVVYRAETLTDVASLVAAGKLYALAERKFALIGMGPLGSITRVCANRFGASLTYVSLEPGKEAAPGQIDLATMKWLGNKAVITGITGHPLEHTVSPAMHNAAFRALRLPGMYFKLPAAPVELGSVTEMMLELDMRGMNVTIPHKESVISLLDRLDLNAIKVGAVNTIINDKGTLIGSNTDLYGVAKTFELANFDAKDKDVLVVGAGGASRAVCAYLSEAGAKVKITNRTNTKAASLADKFDNVTAVEFDSLAKGKFAAVVNCTPVGMKGFPNELPLPIETIQNGMLVLDTIYNPTVTKLMEVAQERGATPVSGKNMLIYQALKAFELWTGKAPTYEVMEQAFREALP
ncbi:MAG TPA: shikimate dehydrogenase [Methanomassiliicoccales archaeon]